MYECFHCGRKSVIWESDDTFEDCGHEGEGIVSHCRCESCGAEIEYRVSVQQQKEYEKNAWEVS